MQPSPRASCAALPSRAHTAPGGVTAAPPEPPPLPPPSRSARGSLQPNLASREQQNRTHALMKTKTQTETCVEAFGSQRDCEMGPVSQIFGKSEQLYERSVPAYEEIAEELRKDLCSNHHDTASSSCCPESDRPRCSWHLHREKGENSQLALPGLRQG